MNIGGGIKKVREDLGLSQQTLTRRLKVSENYVSLMESNRKTPSWEMICRLAAALKVSVTQLVNEAEKLRDE